MKSSFTQSAPVATAILVVFSILSPGFSVAGSLQPTSPPGPTMKTLDEIEPAIPISQEDIPLVISKPGKYYLTANLTFLQSSGTAISIESVDVVIDMRGYILKGTSSSGTYGIYVNNSRYVEVHNGRIQGFFNGFTGDFYTSCRLTNLDAVSNLGRGLSLGGGTGNIVSRCNVTYNGHAGIYSYRDTIITECTAIGNGTQGIDGAYGNTIRDCILKGNGWRGIDAGASATVIGNTCMDNGDCGIYVGEGSIVRNNTVEGSAVHGIAVTYGCTVTNNTAYNNGNIGIHGGNGGTVTDNTSFGNTNFGIAGEAGCLISRNTSRNNTKDGIYAGNNCTVTLNNCYNNGLDGDGAGIRAMWNNRIEANHVTGNDRGIDIVSSGNLVVKNSARANSNAYTITSGNTVGTITSDPTTAGPWANFSY